MYVRGPPAGGRANEVLIKLLRRMSLRASIVGGHRSRVKMVLVEGLGSEEVAGILCRGST